MNIISDNHLHSSFSSDSNASSESMIQKALKLGLTSMCFTEHNDYDYPPEDGKIVFKIDFDSYFDTLSGLRENTAVRLIYGSVLSRDLWRVWLQKLMHSTLTAVLIL